MAALKESIKGCPVVRSPFNLAMSRFCRLTVSFHLDIFLSFSNFKLLFKLIVFCYHVTYEFQSESTLYSCLSVKELLARNRRNIGSLNGCNRIRTHNHLVCQQTLSHLAKWLSVLLRTKCLWVQISLLSLSV